VDKIFIMRIKFKRFRFAYVVNALGKCKLLLKGPLTTLEFPISRHESFFDDTWKSLIAAPKFINALANQIKEALTGLVYGYFCEIIPEGVGYKFLRYEWASQTLGLGLGYGHLIFYNIPPVCFFRCEKYRLFLFSGDKQTLREVALAIINLRVPDPYKGKGLKFAKTPLKLKPGKLRQR